MTSWTPWNPWICMEFVDLHGIHGFAWNLWICMESMDLHEKLKKKKTIKNLSFFEHDLKKHEKKLVLKIKTSFKS